MANPDRAGFRPVRSKYGLTSWDLSFAEPYLVDDDEFDETASAIAVGTPVAQTDTANSATGALGHLGLVIPIADEHVTGVEDYVADDAESDLIAGVVVGISRIGDVSGFNLDFNYGMFHAGPDDLGLTSKYITSAEVEADTDGFLVWVADSQEWLFEGQIETAGAVGRGDHLTMAAADPFTDEVVDTTTGASKAQLQLVSNDGQFIVTHIPRYIDNDPEAANARVWFHVNPRLIQRGSSDAGSNAQNTAA